MQWIECYYDHFVKFLRSPIDVISFTQRADAPFPVDVLVYDKVFDGCRAFCTIGLSNYQSALKTTAEIFLPADDGWDDIPSILANALDYMIQQQRPLGRGRYLSGVENILPRFVETFNKTALYFATPFGLPDGFETATCGNEIGKVYLACFISSAELAFLISHGVEEFEDLLVTHSVDVFHLRRPSCV